MRGSRHVQKVPGIECIELVPAGDVVARLLSRLVREQASGREAREYRSVVRAVILRGEPDDLLLSWRVEQPERDLTDDAVTVRPPRERVRRDGKRQARGD